MVTLIRAGTVLALVVLAGCASARHSDPLPTPSAASSPSSTTAHPAASADVATIDAIIRALYDVISGPKDQPRDWDRMRSLYHANGMLIPTGRTAAGQHVARPMTVNDYISNSGSFLEDIGFREEELARHVDRFGNIAQVFSSYAGYRDGEVEPFLRGINSIQLYYDDTRWWVMNVFWEPERPGVNLPPQYERGGADTGQESNLAVEGTAGFYIPATSSLNQNRRLGWEAGARMTWSLSSQWSVFGHQGYARAANTGVRGEHPERVFSGIEEWRLLAGPEYALSEHFAIAVGLGAVARRRMVTDRDDNPPPNNFPDGNGGGTQWGGHIGLQPMIAWRTDDVTLRLGSLLLVDDFSEWSISIGMGVRLW